VLGAHVHSRLTLAAVIALLLCSLAIMEFPELVNLIDDSSNDFSLVVFAKDAPGVVKVRIYILPEKRRASSAPPYPSIAASINRLIGPFRTSDGMLHLLCTQRT